MIFKKVKRTLMSYSDNFPVFYECIELKFKIPNVPNIFLEIRLLLFLKRISDPNNNYDDKLDKDFFSFKIILHTKEQRYTIKHILV